MKENYFSKFHSGGAEVSAGIRRYCPYCGKSLPAEGCFCPYCGRTLERKAPDLIGIIHGYGIAGKMRAGRALPGRRPDVLSGTFASGRGEALSRQEIVRILEKQIVFLQTMAGRYPREAFYRSSSAGLEKIAARLSGNAGGGLSSGELELIRTQCTFVLWAARELADEDSAKYSGEIAGLLSDADDLQRVICSGVRTEGGDGGKSGRPGDDPESRVSPEKNGEFDPDVREEIESLQSELHEMGPSFKRHLFDPGIDYRKELEQLIGLRSVKEQLTRHIETYKVQLLRKEKHPDLNIRMSFNCIFKGRPGTGKTTVARLVAGILKSEGIVRNGCCVEVDASSLISGYIGFSAKIAKLAALEAVGGVLFIDEAYALMNSKGSRSNPGDEVIDTLTPLMENYRGRLIVILAGYDREMDEFLTQANTGFPSRFKSVISFEDYNAEEMLRIFCKLAESEHYVLEPAARQRMAALLEYVESQKDSISSFANARTVRTLFDTVKERSAGRVSRIPGADPDRLTVEDVSMTPDEFKKSLNIF